MHTEPRTFPINLCHDRSRARKKALEGPTRAEVRGMVARRAELLASARQLESGTLADQLRAVDLDSEAWDVEYTLSQYGYDPETGKQAPHRAR